VQPAPPQGTASSASKADTDPARLRVVAEKALSEKRYIEALKNFNLAAPAFRDDPSFSQQQGLASDKVTALTPAVKFYNEGEYETAIPILWRIVQEDRDNQDARSYLLRSYYNQGITQLQNGLYPKAMQAFREALALDPNDSEAARHLKFAERYQKGDLDLLGRIYVAT
jgi:tetratricopeptide (TPR) repeat protein